MKGGKVKVVRYGEVSEGRERVWMPARWEAVMVERQRECGVGKVGGEGRGERGGWPVRGKRLGIEAEERKDRADSMTPEGRWGSCWVGKESRDERREEGGRPQAWQPARIEAGEGRQRGVWGRLLVYRGGLGERG